MPWNEFLIPLLAGYVFVHLFHLTKFRAQRYDGYRLLIESTLFGAIFFAASRFAILGLGATPFGGRLELWIKRDGLNYPFIGTDVCTFTLAVVLAVGGNIVLGTERAKAIMIKEDDNGFLRLFHKAATESKVVSVTLASKKVYIGYITRTPPGAAVCRSAAASKRLQGQRFIAPYHHHELRKGVGVQ